MVAGCLHVVSLLPLGPWQQETKEKKTRKTVLTEDFCAAALGVCLGMLLGTFCGGPACLKRCLGQQYGGGPPLPHAFLLRTVMWQQGTFSKGSRSCPLLHRV